MKNASRLTYAALALACAAALAACGGGGGSGGGGGGGPVPPTATPVVTATPAPTATPTPGSTPTAARTASPAGAPLPPIEYPSASHPGWKYWGPWSSANAFRFPVQSGFNGQGETIAIVIDATPSMSDVTGYLNYFQVPFYPTRTINPNRSVDGGGLPDGSSGGEATLDTETTAGIAPGANIIVYDVPSLSNTHLVDAYNAIVSDHLANVVNLSFGGCEYPGSKSIENPIFTQMNAAGIAVAVAAGDTGNTCYSDGTTFNPGAQSPASDPNVVGVGGTATSPSTDVITTNQIWNDCASSVSGDNCVSGGGVSGLFTPPPYQAGLPGAVAGGRNVPDIALPGNWDAMYSPTICAGSPTGLCAIGGTSWSAPLAAGLMAEVYQYCQVTSMPNYVAMFYDTFASAGYAAFSDVTVGSDQYFSAPAPFYGAAAGYDPVGGIGQPSGMAVAQHICPGRVLGPLGATRRASAVVERRPAQAWVDDNRIDLGALRGTVDLGRREGSDRTAIAVAIRATSSVHQDEQSVVEALQSAGFTVTQRFGNAGVVDVEGPASLVESYFGTALHDYAQSGGRRFANVAPLTIPAQIAPYVQGVVSDDLVMKWHPPLRVVY
jgi:subtilase family serine protease